jgi:hypothetical protein
VTARFVVTASQKEKAGRGPLFHVNLFESAIRR